MTGESTLPPGVGVVYGPEYLGNLHYFDRDRVPTNYGSFRIEIETLWRYWNGSKQELVKGHYEAECPKCYTEHVVEGTEDEHRSELRETVLACCDDVRWLPPSDWIEDCDVCGHSHRERHECRSILSRDLDPETIEVVECADCDFEGDPGDLHGVEGRCPECETTSVRVKQAMTDGGKRESVDHPEVGEEIEVSARETPMEVTSVTEMETGTVKVEAENHHGTYRLTFHGDGSVSMRAGGRLVSGDVEVETVGDDGSYRYAYSKLTDNWYRVDEWEELDDGQIKAKSKERVPREEVPQKWLDEAVERGDRDV